MDAFLQMKNPFANFADTHSVPATTASARIGPEPFGVPPSASTASAWIGPEPFGVPPLASTASAWIGPESDDLETVDTWTANAEPAAVGGTEPTPAKVTAELAVEGHTEKGGAWKEWGGNSEWGSDGWKADKKRSSEWESDSWNADAKSNSKWNSDEWKADKKSSWHSDGSWSWAGASHWQSVGEASSSWKWESASSSVAQSLLETGSSAKAPGAVPVGVYPAKGVEGPRWPSRSDLRESGHGKGSRPRGGIASKWNSDWHKLKRERKDPNMSFAEAVKELGPPPKR
jgi:hypothetical protein